MSEPIPSNFSVGNIAIPILQDFYDRVCSKGINRQDITGLLRRLLISYFSNPDNIRNEAIKDRVFKEGEDTGILIEAVGRFRPEIAEKRPAILIRPGEWKVLDLGIQAHLIRGDVFQSGRQYALEVAGTHNIIVVSKTPSETEILADEVFKFFALLRVVLPSITPVPMFKVTGISELKAIAEQKTHFYCIIPVRYHIQHIFSIDFIPGE